MEKEKENGAYRDKREKNAREKRVQTRREEKSVIYIFP
jgi:hypothetical protein